MQSSTYTESGQPSWGVGKIAVLIFLIGAVMIGGFFAYYYWERQSQPRVSVVDRETAQWEDRVRQDPTNVELRVNVANMYLQKGLSDPAIKQYGQALNLEADNVGALMGIGVAYSQKGQTDEAIKYLTQVVDSLSGNEFSLVDKRLAAANFYLGKMYLESGRADQAVEALVKSNASDRANADTLNLLGLARQQQGDHSKAVQHFTGALALDPAFTEAYNGIAVSYKVLGDGVKATYAEAMGQLFSGKTDSAISKLEALVASTPDAGAYWGLGWSYELKGQNDKAILNYQKTMALDHTHRLAAVSLQRLEASR